MFDTKTTRNGLTGGKSRTDSKSRLGSLVFYIWTATKYGKTPTQKGFVQSRSGKRNDDLFKMAKATGVIIETGAKIKGSKVIALGPNAQFVNSLHNLISVL